MTQTTTSALQPPPRPRRADGPMPLDRFLDPCTHGFVRVAVAVPVVRVADPRFNAVETVRVYREAAAGGAMLVAFPELGLSAYTCDDLFHQRALLDGCLDALAEVVEASREVPAIAIVGLPLLVEHRLFNCAAVVCGGRVLGVVPKTYLPNYGEFYEARQFASGAGVVTDRDRPARPARALRHRAAVRVAVDPQLHPPRRDLRGRVGADPALDLRRAGRRHGAGQPVGVEHHDRQVGLPPPAGEPAVGALHRRLPLHLGRQRRVDHRPGVGRRGHRLRERRPAGRVAALRRWARSGSPPTSTWSASRASA